MASHFDRRLDVVLEALDEGLFDGARKGLQAVALSAGLLGGAGQAEEPATQNQTQVDYRKFSDQEIQKIVNNLGDKLTQAAKSKRDEIIKLAQQDRDFSSNQEKAVRNAAVQLCIGPLFGLKPPFRQYKLEEAAESYLRGKEDGSEHLLRIERVGGYFGGRAMPVVRGYLDLGNGQNVEILVDSDQTERIVSGALIHKLGSQALK